MSWLFFHVTHDVRRVFTEQESQNISRKASEVPAEVDTIIHHSTRIIVNTIILRELLMLLLSRERNILIGILVSIGAQIHIFPTQTDACCTLVIITRLQPATQKLK